jgi:class 3 adenylate cyclase
MTQTAQAGGNAQVPGPSTATITCLFTDIEGSTRRWEAFPAAMRAALSRHDALLRAAIEGHGGSVFKTVGDAFCTVFADPGAAVLAAVAGQRALAAEPWPADIGGLRVRMALHAGTADERDGDYFGPVLNRVARLLAAGHGGQVLASLAVHEAVASEGEAGRAEVAPGEGAAVEVAGGAEQAAAGGATLGVTFLDLGEHRLKDLARPEHVFQVLAPGLTTDFPPILTLDRMRHNLPIQLSSFAGRE